MDDWVFRKVCYHLACKVCTNSHQRYGCSDSQFARILFCTEGSGHEFEGDLRGWTVTEYTQNKLTLRKNLLMEKYVEDVKKDGKQILELLELIMKATCLAKDTLRQILFKLNQFRRNILKNMVCTFQMSTKIPDLSKISPRAPLFAMFGRLAAKSSNNLGLPRPQAPCTLEYKDFPVATTVCVGNMDI